MTTNNDNTRKPVVSAVSKMETTTQTNNDDTNYYSLELDDMVIALENKDATIKELKKDIEERASECARLRKLGAKTRGLFECEKAENQQLKEQRDLALRTIEQKVYEYTKLKYEAEIWFKFSTCYKKENQQLKELLKECKPYISYSVNKKKYLGWTPPEANILTKIDEVLKCR